VWEALERCWKPRVRAREGASPLSGTLHLAQAQSNRGAGGRKKDFPDAERLVRRLVAQELTLSFVPDAEQPLWRTVMRRKYQITRNRVQLHNRLESLLERGSREPESTGDSATELRAPRQQARLCVAVPSNESAVR